jgi:plasmid stabilization system protein ParE
VNENDQLRLNVPEVYCPMNVSELYFTHHAAQAFRSCIEKIQQVSLIAAERTRNKMLHQLRALQHHPLQGSKKVEVGTGESQVRVAALMQYKVYYKVEDQRVIVLDFLLDQTTRPDTK